MSQKAQCIVKCLLPLLFVLCVPCSASPEFGITEEDWFEFTLVQNQIEGYDQPYVFNGIGGDYVIVPVGETFLVSAESLDFKDLGLTDTMIMVSISDGNQTTYMYNLIYGQGFFVPLNLNSTFRQSINETNNSPNGLSQTGRSYAEDNSTMTWTFDRHVEIQDSSGEVLSWFTAKHIQSFSKQDGVIMYSYYEKRSYGASSASINILEYERTKPKLSTPLKTNTTETRIKIPFSFSGTLIGIFVLVLVRARTCIGLQKHEMIL